METLSYAQLMQRCIELTEQRDAVVAENAALKEFVSECSITQGVGNWTSDVEKAVYVPATEWMPQTPNTDAILAFLLAEREADKALIVELQQGCENDPHIHEIIDLNEQITETNDALCKLLPGVQYMDPPDGGCVTPLEQVSRMVADYRQRIAELEARTLTVTLPPVSFFDFKLGSGFASGAYVNVEALNKGLTAAGIPLVVGGEDATN